MLIFVETPILLIMHRTSSRGAPSALYSGIKNITETHNDKKDDDKMIIWWKSIKLNLIWTSCLEISPCFCGIIQRLAKFNRLIRQAWSTEYPFLPGNPRWQWKTDYSQTRIVCMCFLKKRTQDWFECKGNKVQCTCMVFTEDLCTLHN